MEKIRFKGTAAEIAASEKTGDGGEIVVASDTGHLAVTDGATPLGGLQRLTRVDEVPMLDEDGKVAEENIPDRLSDSGLSASMDDAVNDPTSDISKDRQATVGIDPRQFGVTFDGITDDTAAWTSLIAALGANDLIVFPKKSTSLISSGITFGSGLPDLSIISRGSKIKLKTGSSSGTVMVALVGARQYVHGLHTDGNSIAGVTGIRPRADQQTIAFCDFTDCIAGGVYFQGASHGTKVTGCNFRGNAYGICVEDSSTVGHVAISDNSFEGGNLGDGICINTPAGGAVDLTITGNVIRNYTDSNTNAGMGISLARVAGAVVTGNIVTDCANDGIHVEDDSPGAIITSNRVARCGGAGISLMVGAGVVRTDTATVTSGSATVTDASVLSANTGLQVSGTGIPAGVRTYVGTVVNGVSFKLSSSPTSQVDVLATANGTSVVISRRTPRDFDVSHNTVEDCATGTTAIAGIALTSPVPLGDGTISQNTVNRCGRAGATNVFGIDLGTSSFRLTVIGNHAKNTVGGTVSAGIRFSALSDSQVIGNDCYDDQPTKTQRYGIAATGVCTNVQLDLNNLNGNIVAPMEESGLSTASFAYSKRGNRPASVNSPEILPLNAGAITTDASFVAFYGNAFPENGMETIDSTNGRHYVRLGTDTWKFAKLRTRVLAGTSNSKDFASIPANSTAESNITVTGATVGDQVTIVPNYTLEAGLMVYAYVTATNTVTLRLANVTTSAIDPGAGTWNYEVRSIN